jgi:hypothetical protein
MAKKITKAAAIMELLNNGVTGANICRRLNVSPGYVSMLKKQMAHKADEEKVDKLAEDILALDAAEEAKAKEVDTVLDTRADQYGSFMQGADIAIRIKSIMHNAVARNDMHVFPDQLLALDMIAVKISRIVNGNASHRDSWLDIAGYAKLVADRLGGVSR